MREAKRSLFQKKEDGDTASLEHDTIRLDLGHRHPVDRLSGSDDHSVDQRDRIFIGIDDPIERDSLIFAEEDLARVLAAVDELIFGACVALAPGRRRARLLGRSRLGRSFGLRGTGEK